MNDYYDKEEIDCTHCGHRWILLSDKEITDDLFHKWLIKIYFQHKDLTGGLNEKEN